MYAASLVFLGAAVVALFVGLRDGGLALIFVSIGSSVMSGLFLVVSVLRGRDAQEEAQATSAWEPAPKPKPEPEEPSPADVDPFETLAQRGVVGTIDEPPPLRRRSGTKRRSGPTVVAIPERGTYHLSSCRFVEGRGETEEIPRATAKRRGFSPCRVCKPG